MEEKSLRILIIDDNNSIHQDFRKVLLQEKPNNELNKLKDTLFPDENPVSSTTTDSAPIIQIDSASQGEVGFEMVKKALEEKHPYALAFVDVRMPPGWDGIMTVKRIWEIDPELQVVICSAYSDIAFENIHKELKQSDGYLILKKPFDTIEIRQIAASLTKKWQLMQQAKSNLQQLETMVEERTKALNESMSVFKATLEATQEGIFGVDLNHKVNAYNLKFLNIWNIDESLLKQNNAELVFKHMAELTDDPALFLFQMHALDQNIFTFKRDWNLTSGKQIEIYAQSQFTDHELSGYVLSFRDITTHKELEKELLHKATHDILTGLPNRILVQDRIQQAINQCANTNLGVGIFIVDIDNFKYINETLSHLIGDKILKIIANKLRLCLRESDTVARFGGDEFILVLPRVKPQDLINKAHELLKIFHEPIITEDNNTINITASIGISIYPKDGTETETLLKNVDYALYQAKTIGRNTFQFYTSEFSEYLLAREKLIKDLQTAIQENQFIIYYQPLVRIEDRSITGVEALIRWNHPTRGILYPVEFLQMIEESGLMSTIGEWVMRNACLQAKKWHETIDANLSMAINISPSQFNQMDFIALVQRIIEETEVNPKMLEFEITENLILENSGDVVKHMHALKKLGIRLSMDDFGTGYASLSYLKSFPFDKIKIDKSFVNGLMNNRIDRSIIEAIITMAKQIGVTVLAEGVSNEAELNFLKEQGTSEFQGFYFSPAVPSEECTRLIQTHLKK